MLFKIKLSFGLRSLLVKFKPAVYILFSVGTITPAVLVSFIMAMLSCMLFRRKYNFE